MVFGAKDRSFCKGITDIGSKTTMIESLFTKLQQEVLINTDLLVKKEDQ